jgi:hypothetical protein
MPEHQKSNNAFGQIYTDAFYNYDGYKIGVFSERISQIGMNDGLIELWYYAQKDFLKLLVSKDIYKRMEPKQIEGKGNYCDTNGLFIQKVFRLNNSHYLSAKLKLNYANELHYIKADGYTNSEKFVGSFDYIYSSKNLISNNPTTSQSPQGIGYGIDIEYIYHEDKLYFYAGVFNLGSYIYWENVNLMHYDFNSEVIYKGDDEYNHYRPFGVGYYKYDISFKQKLPQYYKASLNYELFDSIAFGNNFKLYEDMYSNEPYINFKVYNGRYKLGYQMIDNTMLLGAYYKNFNIECANKFTLEGNILQASIKISF